MTHAYSLDLHSPPGIAHHPELSTHGVEHLQTGALNLMDSGDVPVLTEQHHPVLQPTCHPTMCYPPQAPRYTSDIQHGPTHLKIERSDQDFPGHDLHISPVYIHPVESLQSAPVPPQQDSEPYHLHPTDVYTLQYQSPHGFMSTDTIEPYFFPDAVQGDGGPGMLQPMKATPTRRGPFKDMEKRKETATTRKMGSCIRCRMQRIRVRWIPMCCGLRKALHTNDIT